MLKYIIYITILFLFCSCEKEIELQLDKGQDKLVVNSFFYPDTNFRVYVSSTKLITDNKSSYINDAEVKLFENGIFIETLTFESKGWYISTNKPNYDTKYKIEVTYGNQFVWAESYVPLNIDYFYGEHKLLYKQGSIDASDPIFEVEYFFNFLDTKKQENYYQILEGNVLQTERNYSKINNKSILEDSEISYNPSSLFFKDIYFKNDTSNLRINILREGWFNGNDLGSFTGRLKSLSKEYYLFLKTWVKHKFNQNSDINLEDPFSLVFQGEPIEMYSNVIGGYGVFAGFNKTEVEFVFVP